MIHSLTRRARMGNANAFHQAATCLRVDGRGCRIPAFSIDLRFPNRPQPESNMISSASLIRLCAVLYVLSSFRAVADEADKLAPLTYNNPGLEVDLGVGLWAYPLPMDYDNDGDMDLVVSCPDKPSNGTYLFENPTDDPTIKLPVFKPAVRLGKGAHYMLLSRVAGEPVVVRPSQVYRRDAKTNQFNFSKSSKIEGAIVNPNALTNGRTRGNMWRFVDFDGDGDADIVVGSGDWSDLGWDHAYDRDGQWRNGPLHGYLYLLENEGNDANPKYSNAPERIQAAGQDIDVYGWPCHNFQDFDGDGDLDILTGNFLDQFTYFENVGTRTEPVYSGGVLLNDDGGDPLVMHLQMITPTAIDWDKDGDFDLIVGDEDGRVALVENTGGIRDRQPVFKSPVYFKQQADTLKFGALATPYSFDWDGDGDDDIVCGNTAGNIGLFENLGMGEGDLPKWASPVLLNVRNDDGLVEPFRVMAGPNGSIQGPCEAKWGYTTLSVADWDGDGDGDIVYNSILAEVGLLINEGGTLTRQSFDTGLMESPPVWYPHIPKSATTLTQWRTTPIVMDFDRDDTLDLILLDQEGYLTLRRQCGNAERLFIDEAGNPIRLNSGTAGRSGRVKISVADWDNDDRLDVLVNSENVTWYRNVADHGGKVVLKKVGNLSTRNVAGHTASPAVCDFNRDGVVDMMIGSENGRIYHIFHHECVHFSQDQTSAELRFNSAGSVSELPPPPMKDGHNLKTSETTRGRVAVWVRDSTEKQSSETVRYAYHDGIKWSAASTIHHEQNRNAKITISDLTMTQSNEDEAVYVGFAVSDGTDSKIDVSRVSYDRGRTFRQAIDRVTR